MKRINATGKGTSSRKRLRSQTEADIDRMSPSDFVTLNGLQYALPYRFDFTMHFKPRWRGLTLMSVFTSEFPHAGRAYWEGEITGGRVLANGEPAEVSTRWRVGLTVVHAVHRHESPVRADGIDELYRSDELVAVSKPASLPVHPCGTYRRNSLLFLVATRLGLRGLRVVHRLDKEVSGVVIFARTKQAAADFNEHMRAQRFSKVYLAEVDGRFPFTSAHECSTPLYWNPKTMRSEASPEKGKEARTVFRLIENRPETCSSLVEAVPKTGRTHQLRCHLFSLGHPIVGDALYGPSAEGDAEVDAGAEHVAIQAVAGERASNAFNEGKALGCSTCPRLGSSRGRDGAAAVIRLHAARYSRGDWKVEAPPPAWATRRRGT